MAFCDYHLCEKCEGKAFYDANMSLDDEGGHWGTKIVALCRECVKNWDIAIVPKIAQPASVDLPNCFHCSRPERAHRNGLCYPDTFPHGPIFTSEAPMIFRGDSLSAPQPVDTPMEEK